jgi:hypothetical protein
MKKMSMSIVVALFVLITLGLTGCISPSDDRGASAWDRPDSGDMTALPIEWNH